MQKNYPKISVVTPVKNSVKTLESAIQSVIKQNYPNLEYIVIDGASTDGTLDIIKKYEKFINYWHSKDDRNVVVATIEGIKAASGDIVCFLNADDFYEPNILFKVAQEFIKNPQIEIVSCLYRVLKQEDSKLKTIEKTTPKKMELNKNKIVISYGFNARFFSKNVFRKYGLMITHDDQNRTFLSNDVEYMIRLLLLETSNHVIDYIGYTYLSHDSSATFSRKNSLRLCEDKIFVAKKFLNSDLVLPQIWQKTFKKWIKKYRAKIAASQLKKFELTDFFKSYTKGINENGFFAFSFYFLKASFRD